MGVLGYIRKVTIPHRLSAEPFGPGPLCRCATSPHTVGSHPLHKGAFNSTPIEFLLAPEGSMWEEEKIR